MQWLLTRKIVRDIGRQNNQDRGASGQMGLLCRYRI